MAAIVDIISRHGLMKRVIETNLIRAKLALYKPLLHIYSHLKQLYISNKTKRSVVKVSVAYMGVCISRHLKEELAWATDKKWLQVISNIMLFKTVIPLRY